jgi:hypothetical protein
LPTERIAAAGSGAATLKSLMPQTLSDNTSRLVVRLDACCRGSHPVLPIHGTARRRLGVHDDVNGDIDHHLIPDFYRRATERAGQSVRGGLRAPWSQAGAVSFMDEAGIDAAIASIRAPRFDAVSAQVCLPLWVSFPACYHSSGRKTILETASDIYSLNRDSEVA